MNTGKEYNDIMHRISKGNIVDGKEDMYSTFKDGSLNNSVTEDSDVEEVLFWLNMCILIKGGFDVWGM
jgi:hypothetical protein